MTLSGVPANEYNAIVKIVTGGVPGSGQFQYSLNGGSTYSSTITIPSGGTYAIPGTSTNVVFSPGTYVVNTAYSWTSTQQALYLNWAPTVGHAIGVTHADTNVFYNVLEVTESGSSYRVVVDRPCFAEWTSGDEVTEYTSLPHDIRVDGRGMQISGLGGHGLFIADVYRVDIRDTHIVTTYGTPGTGGFGFDGCQHALLDHCSVDMTGSVNADGAYFQGCERSVMRAVAAHGGSYGLTVSDCFQSGLENCWAYNNVTGAQLITLNAAGVNYGCIDCFVSGGGAIGCQVGLTVQGCTRATVTSFKATNCTAQGILVQPGPSGVPNLSNRFIGCDATYCTRGLWVLSGCVDTRAVSLDVTGCGPDAGVWADDSLSIYGLVAESMAAPVINVTAGKHRYENLRITYTGGSSIDALALNGTIHTVRGGYIDMTACGTPSVGILCVGGTTYVDDVTVTGAGVGLQVLSGAICYMERYSKPLRLLAFRAECNILRNFMTRRMR